MPLKKITSKLRKPFPQQKPGGLLRFPPGFEVPAHFDESERRDFLLITRETVKRSEALKPEELMECAVLASILGMARETRQQIKAGVDVPLNAEILAETLSECRRSARNNLKLSDEAITQLF